MDQTPELDDPGALDAASDVAYVTWLEYMREELEAAADRNLRASGPGALVSDWSGEPAKHPRLIDFDDMGEVAKDALEASHREIQTYYLTYDELDLNSPIEQRIRSTIDETDLSTHYVLAILHPAAETLRVFRLGRADPQGSAPPVPQ